ncbi:MAG: DNA alkylation repair protein, partial [archaeon]|nr:DNA alkylation repair protein [archaeon]
MTPEELEAYFIENRDLKYRDFSKKIILDTDMIGVRTPLIRSVAKKIVKEDWRTFMESPSRSYEHTLVRALVIGTAKMDGKERLERTKAFIPEVTNWAINDMFCSSWKVDKGIKEELWDYCMELISTGEEFPMRV